jgi:hypothetical protein
LATDQSTAGTNPNGGGAPPQTALSGQFTLTVGSAPSITVQPTNQTAKVGATAVFSLTAAAGIGGALSYQWQFNGANVGISSAAYSRSGVVVGDHGKIVHCTVSEVGNGSTTSVDVTLSVAVTFQGSVPPQSGITGSAFSVNLTSYFSGGTAYTFALLTGNMPTGLTQVGSTGVWSGTLGAAGSGTFTVRATDVGGNVDQTNTVTWQITSASSVPAVQVQPANLTVVAGSPASFLTAFTGSPIPSLQWQELTGSVYSDMPGQTSGTLLLAATALSDSGRKFRCAGTNSAGGPVYTSLVTLTVTPIGALAPGALPIALGVTLDGKLVILS